MSMKEIWKKVQTEHLFLIALDRIQSSCGWRTEGVSMDISALDHVTVRQPSGVYN